LIAITLEGSVLEDLLSGVAFRWNYRDYRSIAVADEWRTAENRAALLGWSTMARIQTTPATSANLAGRPG